MVDASIELALEQVLFGGVGGGGWSRRTVDLSVFNNSFNSKGLILHDSEICGEKIQ